jgi:hypothetical protein
MNMLVDLRQPSTRWPLSRTLAPGEGDTLLVLEARGVAPVERTLAQLLEMHPEEDAARSWAADFLPLATGSAQWTLADGTTARARYPVDRQPGRSTPWGKAQMAWSYAPGLTRYGCAGHGGFHVAGLLLATIPEDVQAATHDGAGLAGWFEEDEDAHILALAFPEAFSAAQVHRAGRVLVGDLHRAMLRVLGHSAATARAGGAAHRWRAGAARLTVRAEAVMRWNPAALRDHLAVREA